jgi:hypothetical protein
MQFSTSYLLIESHRLILRQLVPEWKKSRNPKLLQRQKQKDILVECTLFSA